MPEHLLHYSFTALPFLIILFLLLRKARFTAFQKLGLATLILFLFLHVGPFTQVFAQHHQSQSPAEHHPCCLHQVGATTEIVSFVIAIVTVQQFESSKPVIHKPIITSSYFTRAPPVSV